MKKSITNTLLAGSIIFSSYKLMDKHSQHYIGDFMNNFDKKHNIDIRLSRYTDDDYKFLNSKLLNGEMVVVVLKDNKVIDICDKNGSPKTFAETKYHKYFYKDTGVPFGSPKIHQYYLGETMHDKLLLGYWYDKWWKVKNKSFPGLYCDYFHCYDGDGDSWDVFIEYPYKNGWHEFVQIYPENEKPGMDLWQLLPR